MGGDGTVRERVLPSDRGTRTAVGFERFFQPLVVTIFGLAVQSRCNCVSKPVYIEGAGFFFFHSVKCGRPGGEVLTREGSALVVVRFSVGR